MDVPEYTFSSINNSSVENEYYLQLVSNRKLSDIYHSHNFYEVFLLLNGSCVHYINGKAEQLNAGNCSVVIPGQAHKFVSQSENLKLLGVSVIKNEFEKLADCFDLKFSDTKSMVVFPCADILSSINTILSGIYFQSYNKFDCKLLLCTIFNSVSKRHLKINNNIPFVLTEAVDKMKSEENISKDMSYFLAITGYSYSHLYRLMKQYYGQTPHEFLQNLKLENAYAKIVLTDIPIEEIALNCGYISLSNFYCAFKKNFNITPGEPRKNRSENNTL